MAITQSRSRLNFDSGWLFHPGDVPAPVANKHLAAYMANKAGYARGAARGNFDDSDWHPVRLPHDWSVDGPFTPDHHVNSGFLPRGVGWYRRHFRLDEADRGKVLTLHFDAIASHAQVFVNGHLLTRSFNGYLPVVADVSDVVTFGDELNVVAVRVDATPMEGWWYEGAGLYRHAWITKRSAVHIADDGIVVRTKKSDNDSWNVTVRVTAEHKQGYTKKGVVVARLFDPAGNQILADEKTAKRYGAMNGTHEFQFRVTSPSLWDIDSPSLYRAECDLIDDGDVIDRDSARFGFRTIEFRGGGANDVPGPGFYLNGRHLFLKGTCYHQDHAGVGVALPDGIHRFRVQRLKDMGCNAVRIGHHPPAPEFLDACDELGLLVMDENRTFGSAPEYMDQLRAMVRRDINRPCVFLWSVCNEEAIQGTVVARNITEAMVREVKRLDPTRPVTAAISGGILNDNAMSEVIDVMSINYSFATLDPFHAKWPEKPVVSSETGCTLATRGTYKTEGHFFADYDGEHERWGSTAAEAWRQVTGRPWMAGLFVWTGFEYRGEPSPHEWPSVSSHWGLLDLCGFEKSGFWRHKAWFNSPVGATPAPPAAGTSTVAGDAGVAPTEDVVLHLLPHWNWQAGETVRVQAITNADEIELLLNDQSIGRKAVELPEFPEWNVPFEPGELKAVAYRGGAVVATASHITTGPAVGLGVELHPSCDTPFVADGEAAWPVTVFAIDTAGRRVPTAEPPLTISLEGEAELIGVGNGDPNGHFANRGPTLPLFRGLAQAIVRATETAGDVTVRVTSPGLADGTLTFRTAAIPLAPKVPAAQRRYFLNDWLMGPISPTPPDVNVTAAGTDMNTWERVKAAGPQTAWQTASGYALYRATLKPPKAMNERGGRIVFAEITGDAEIFVDGMQQPAGNVIDLPPRTTPAEIVVRLKGDAANAGLTGPVELRLV
ncbi:MAG: glycoside hydrolase family 2 TIM barrel-domain containing protein [Tepidisphaeraceae bacterium]